MTTNAKAYLALVEAFNEYRITSRYITDLFIVDAQKLGVYPQKGEWEIVDGMPFGWIMRDSGTELASADTNLENNGINYFQREFENHQNRITNVRKDKYSHANAYDYDPTTASTYLYFWWDGETLQQVHSPATILDRMRHYQETHKP